MTSSRQPVRILFVCSANLCRSVTAAEYARRAADDSVASAVEWHFESAGTHVVPDQRLPPKVAATMRELGIPHRDQPRPLDEPLVRGADLILTAERRHRASVVERFPFAVRSTFTLLQFVRLLDAGRDTAPDLVANGATLQELARIGQTNVQPLEDVSIDVSDPVISDSHEAMRRCAAIVASAVERIVG